MSVRVQKGGFMVDLLLRLSIGPNVVFENLALYISSVHPSRHVRPVVAVVVICPPVRPVVVARPLSVRPSRGPSRRRPSSVRPSWSSS